MSQSWPLEDEVLHLREEVKNQQRRINELLQLLSAAGTAVAVTAAAADTGGGLWIFGYGSLMYNPGSIPFVRSATCFVRGWRREFRQRSTDHRGTVEAPGRVVTLVRDETSTCFGVAYHVREADVASVLSYLDYREKDNYDRVHLAIYAASDGSLISEAALCYVGKPETLYEEEPDLDIVARHIAKSRGPSGPNAEYCLNLQRALSKHHLSCPHVFEVASRLQHLE